MQRPELLGAIEPPIRILLSTDPGLHLVDSERVHTAVVDTEGSIGGHLPGASRKRAAGQIGPAMA